MIKTVFIGASGHFQFTLTGSAGQPDVLLAAAAPGCPGEPLDNLISGIRRLGTEPALYDDYREMLRREKPDLAVIDTCYGSHAACAEAALEAGCHVFLEKPAATTLSQLERLRRAYEKAGTQLTAMFNYRYTGSFYRARQLIREGAVGEVRLLNAQKSYKLGERPDFTRSRSSYGGTIPWVGIHAIDWISWMSGQRFVSVSALQSRMHNGGFGTLEADALVQFRMTAPGAPLSAWNSGRSLRTTRCLPKDRGTALPNIRLFWGAASIMTGKPAGTTRC
ncbi:MAG: Gfo/Idh/MocA family oxidoreductase [Firmicutes bacterium]|nr:Gfo/Idh/MocA family oxidoreductase [Bacillota bacterium]